MNKRNRNEKIINKEEIIPNDSFIEDIASPEEIQEEIKSEVLSDEENKVKREILLERQRRLAQQTSTEHNARPSGFYAGLRARIIASLTVQVLFIFLGVIALMLANNNMVTHSFHFNENSSLNYQVCYIEDPLFSERCLPSGRRYVANLIDYIDVSFNYAFNGSKYFNYTYTYSITATVIATERGTAGVIFDEVYILLPERTVSEENSTGFDISEDIQIDFGYYNNIINTLRRDHVLLLDSRVFVTLNVRMDGNHPDIETPVQVNRDITIEIQLSEQTLDVGMSYENLNVSYVVHSENENELLTMLYYALAVISFFIVLILVIRFIKLIIRITSSNSLYKKRLDKIMREYGLVIVESRSIPEIPNQKLYEIPTMEELLDVQNILQKPIMFVKIHAEKSCFMITNNEEVYRYIMKAVDVEKE